MKKEEIKKSVIRHLKLHPNEEAGESELFNKLPGVTWPEFDRVIGELRDALQIRSMPDNVVAWIGPTEDRRIAGTWLAVRGVQNVEELREALPRAVRVVMDHVSSNEATGKITVWAHSTAPVCYSRLNALRFELQDAEAAAQRAAVKVKEAARGYKTTLREEQVEANDRVRDLRRRIKAEEADLAEPLTLCPEWQVDTRYVRAALKTLKAREASLTFWDAKVACLVHAPEGMAIIMPRRA